MALVRDLSLKKDLVLAAGQAVLLLPFVTLEVAQNAGADLCLAFGTAVDR